ncbi:hypothetical protein SAMN05443377_10583 [Propionibacterium cyclohexanicum]|uniref:Uncharacterized protein n=1 Tax=Propionibacterium cyclohexanicum TaxID=64702 RepID=A0A1H9R3V8_9ACTN|nr:hypothetical protein [Propionibacterium cyclohexanicum]SER66719.1 hypothetical protein SAMN05443377_10583 [Propionibacterium cyclohexanicum]
MTIRKKPTVRPAMWRRAAGAVLAAGLLSAAAAGCAAASSPAATSPSEQRVQLASRSLPSYLPSGSTGNQLIAGTAATPAVSMQGVAVRVVLKDNSSVVTNVVGPDVDRTSGDPEASSVDCGFTLSFQQASAPIPLDLATVTATDDAGGIHHLELAPGQGAPPATINPGQTLTVKVHAWLPSGEGLIRWAPDGRHVAAVWDYIAEID